jgi:hypothetical protein
VRQRIAALDSTTGIAVEWDPGADGRVSALSASGSTVYAGGTFTTVGGQARNGIAAVDAATGGVTDWDPAADAGALAFAVKDSTVYVGGWFNRIEDRTRNHVAALNARTGAAEDWEANADGTVLSLVLGGSSIYACGSFGSVNGIPLGGIAALPQFVAKQDSTSFTRIRVAPNPFGASTVLRFSLAKTENVTLRVYDIAGREVATLLESEQRGPGPQQVELPGRGLRQGIYFCRLESGSATGTVKIVHFIP